MSADEVGWRRGKEHDEGVGLEATVQQTTPATPAAVRGLRTRASAVDEGALSMLLLLRLSAVADLIVYFCGISSAEGMELAAPAVATTTKRKKTKRKESRRTKERKAQAKVAQQWQKATSATLQDARQDKRQVPAADVVRLGAVLPIPVGVPPLATTSHWAATPHLPRRQQKRNERREKYAQQRAGEQLESAERKSGKRRGREREEKKQPQQKAAKTAPKRRRPTETFAQKKQRLRNEKKREKNRRHRSNRKQRKQQ
jgi:hypothetical protein